MKTPRPIITFGYAYVFAALFNAVLVIAKEESSILKDWMTAVSGHHWLTHGIIVITLFVLVGLLAQRGDPRTGASAMAWWIAGATIASAVAIDGFFLFFA